MVRRPDHESGLLPLLVSSLRMIGTVDPRSYALLAYKRQIYLYVCILVSATGRFKSEEVALF